MTTNQHENFTSGPWHIDEDLENDIYNDDGEGSQRELLASVYPMKRDGKYMSWKANSRLIAAAPELFALVAHVLECDLYCCCGGGQVDTLSAGEHHHEKCVVVQAESLLRKVRGQ